VMTGAANTTVAVTATVLIMENFIVGYGRRFEVIFLLLGFAARGQ
jgi:hypothetical protein